MAQERDAGDSGTPSEEPPVDGPGSGEAGAGDPSDTGDSSQDTPGGAGS